MHLLLLGHHVVLDTSLLPHAVADRLEHLWRPCAAPGAEPSGGPGAEPSGGPGAEPVAGPDAADGAPALTVRLLPPDHPERPGEHDLRLTDLEADESYAVSQHLTRLAIGLASGSLLLLHAAALAPTAGAVAEAGREPQEGPGGGAVPVVGVVAPSGTGKTTFCLRLADDFHYLTDETLAVDPTTHAVLPYPKPLSLASSGPGEATADAWWGKVDHAPADLGLTPLTPATRLEPPTPQPDADRAPLPDTAVKTPAEAPVRAAAGARGARLAALVLARRVEQGNTLEPLDLAQALMATIAQSSSLYRLEHPLLTLARALTLAGGPWRLSFSDQARCAELLTALATGPDAEPAPFEHLPGVVARTDAAGESDGADADGEGVPVTRLRPAAAPVLDESTRLVRAPWDDAVASEGSVVLLYGRSPVALAGPGAAAWSACETSRTFEEVHEAVVAAIGEHPDSRQVLTDVVVELVCRGILVVAPGPDAPDAGTGRA